MNSNTATHVDAQAKSIKKRSGRGGLLSAPDGEKAGKLLPHSPDLGWLDAETAVGAGEQLRLRVTVIIERIARGDV
jgi:hypothetical protein